MLLLERFSDSWVTESMQKIAKAHVYHFLFSIIDNYWSKMWLNVKIVPIASLELANNYMCYDADSSITCCIFTELFTLYCSRCHLQILQCTCISCEQHSVIKQKENDVNQQKLLRSCVVTFLHAVM